MNEILLGFPSVNRRKKLNYMTEMMHIDQQNNFQSNLKIEMETLY